MRTIHELACLNLVRPLGYFYKQRARLSGADLRCRCRAAEDIYALFFRAEIPSWELDSIMGRELISEY